MTRANRTPAAQRRAARAERESRRRFYISLSVGNSLIATEQERRRPRYQRYVWPKLFLTAQQAWEFARDNGVFKNFNATAQRGRIKSYSIESVLLQP